MRNHSRTQRALSVAVACLIATANLAVSAQDPYVAPDLIRTEAQSIISTAEGWARFEDRAAGLKTPVSKSDLDALQAEADAIKRSLPEFQRTLTSSIGKLKNAGKWTPQLDAFVEQKLKDIGMDNQLVLTVRTAGGFRALMDRAIATAPQIGSELDKRISDLRGTTVIQHVAAFFLGTPVEARMSGGCFAVLVGIAVYGVLGASAVPGASLGAQVLSRHHFRHCSGIPRNP